MMRAQGLGSGLSGLSGMAGAGASLATLIHDQFTDANGTDVTAHTIAPTNVPGAVWSQFTWGTIASNRYGALVGGRHYCNAGVADAVISATFCITSGQVYMLIGRLSDANNYWICKLTSAVMEIIERNGGTETVRASQAVTLATTPAELAVRAAFAGQSIEFVAAGNSLSYASAAFNQSATRFGLKGLGGSSDYVD